MAELTSAIPSASGKENELLELADVPPGGELPATSPESSDALDKLLLEVKGEPSTDLSEEDKAAAEALAAEEAAAAAKAKEAAQTPEEKLAAEKAAADALAADEAAAKAKEAAQTPEEKAAAEKAAAEAKAKETPAEKKDVFDEVQLPPYTKPKAAEAFAKVKEIARTQEATALKTITDLSNKVSTLEAELKKGLPAETKQELEELRAFRAKLDVEADPKFKEWDGRINENVEAIYAKMLAAGVAKPELIEEIKKMGGPALVDWEKLSDKIPQHVKRYIEGKLFENEDLTEKRDKALATAKANAQEYVKSRQTETEKAGESRKQAVAKEVENLLPQLEWMQEQKPTDKSTPEEKKSIEAHNTLLKNISSSIRDAQEDDSPEGKAILVLGFAQLQKVRADFASFKTTAAAEKAAVEAELKEAKDLIARIKKSSTGRVNSSAPDPKDKTVVKKEVNINEDGGSALDRHLAEVRAQQA